MSFYRLYRYELSRIGLLTFILALAALLLPQWLLKEETAGMLSNALKRYEDLFLASGSPQLFFILCALLLAGFLLNFYRGYWRSKSIYTLIALPVRREALYFAKLLALLTAFLILIAAELLAIRLGYGYTADRMMLAGQEGPMANGLFLAFLRCDFFRLLLPLNFSRMLSTAALLLAATTGAYYAALCERSRRRLGLTAAVVAFAVILRVIGYRLGESAGSAVYHAEGLYPSSILLLAASAGFVWHSIVLYKKGAIA